MRPCRSSGLAAAAGGYIIRPYRVRRNIAVHLVGARIVRPAQASGRPMAAHGSIGDRPLQDPPHPCRVSGTRPPLEGRCHRRKPMTERCLGSCDSRKFSAHRRCGSTSQSAFGCQLPSRGAFGAIDKNCPRRVLRRGQFCVLRSLSGLPGRGGGSPHRHIPADFPRGFHRPGG